MPKVNQEVEVVSAKTPEDKSASRVTEHGLQMLLATLDNDSGFSGKVNEEHITQIIAQRKTAMDYTKSDRDNDRWDNKFYFLISLLAAVVFIGMIGWLKPEYFPEAMSGVCGILAGLGGGYGFAKK